MYTWWHFFKPIALQNSLYLWIYLRFLKCTRTTPGEASIPLTKSSYVTPICMSLPTLPYTKTPVTEKRTSLCERYRYFLSTPNLPSGSPHDGEISSSRMRLIRVLTLLLHWRFCVFLLRNSWVGCAYCWGPVVTDSAAINWIGGFSPHQHTGEMSAIYHALKWRSENAKDHALRYPAELILSPRTSTAFAKNSSQTRCTKPILPQRVRHLLLV